MSNKITVAVVNPKEKTISIKQIEAGLQALYEEIQCTTVDCVAMGDGVDMWIDDEGLLCDWSEQGFFKLGYHYPVAGTAVFCRESNGEMASLTDELLLPDFWKGFVTWCDYRKIRFPGTTITTVGEDGKPKTECIGPEWLTHSNH